MSANQGAGPDDDEPLLSRASRLIDEGKLAASVPLLRVLSVGADDWATVMLGWMYMTGHGVEEDRAEATVLFRQAAARNDERGMFYLGRILADARDYAAAVECFSRCGDRGFPPCQLWLGLSYLRGLGVQADDQKAVEYLQLAAKAGNYPTRRELSVLMTRGKLGVTRIPIGPLLFAYWFLVAIFKSAFSKSTDHVNG